MSAGLKKGYKQTEVGVIPGDWKLTFLGAITQKIGSGITPRGGNKNYITCGRPFVRSQNVGWGHFILDDLVFIDEHTHQTFPETELKCHDVLLNITGASIGRSAVVSTELAGGNVNQHVCIIRPDRNKLSSCFANAFIISYLGQGQIDSFQAGGNREGLNFGQIRSIKIALPPSLSEQEAIAEALGDADALIESLEKLIAKKRLIKQGAMQELLTGRKRLPGFSGKWELKKLGEMGTCYRGVSYNPNTDLSAFDTDLTVRLLRSNNIQEAKVVLCDMQFVDHQRVSATQILQKNDILICMANGSKELVGKAGRFTAEDGYTYTFGAFMGCFRPNGHLADIDYIFYLFQTENYRDHILLLLAGSSINNLRPRELEAFSILVPLNADEQSAIATILSDMDAELETLERKLDKARKIKQGMMQELLTGRIRLLQPHATVAFTVHQQPEKAAPAAIGFVVAPKAGTHATEPSKGKSHNWAINEAVVISVLAKRFGSEQWPLGRRRYTKLSYLMHRHIEHKAEGYLKKAAGPYNPDTKYRGPENIAQKNKYVRMHHNGKYEAFVASENIVQAEAYFQEWYGPEALQWLEQFHFKKNDELELLATVDMAMEDLRKDDKAIDLSSVRQVIHDNPEWTAKLKREIFSDANIVRATRTCRELFA